jgi:energy-coupling factor transporter ATP-binding protein EcfA2
MNEQVLVYEVKSSAVSNAKELFSHDKKYFYWNDSKFKKLNEGDYVFVVNTFDKWVLFTKFLEERIPTDLDSKKLISSFSHNGKSFKPVAPSVKKLKDWKSFIHLEVLLLMDCPNHWTWKTLGSSETTYLHGKNVNTNSAENRIRNIEQIKELSPNPHLQKVLQECMSNFSNAVLIPEIVNVIETEELQKALQKAEFHFQKGTDKLKEYEKFTGLDKRGFEKLLEDFINSKKTYSTFISDLDEDSNSYKAMKLIGEVVSYCDYNAADKNILNTYGDKRVLAKASVRQTNWVKWLLKYRIDDFDLNDIPFNIKNAIVYLKDPSRGLTMLSENYRENVAVNLLKVKYKPEGFIEDLFSFFEPYNLKPQNPKNLSWILSYILYQDSVKALWDFSPTNKQMKKKDVSFKQIISHVHQYIESKGFKYEYEDVANFFLSLKTKPFVILAGISGTGKTQLPRRFAEAIGMEKEVQVIQVPVRPDWTDSSDLIGYTALDGNFVPKPLTEAILKAKNDKEKKPYFFILDEMNLARVEHYFSDFLSIIETREFKEGKILTDVIIRDDALKSTNDKQKYGDLRWPENLFLIGTVNMDETTHAFSRKVLDRANSIEMNSIDLNWINPGKNKINTLDNSSLDLFYTEYVESKQLSHEEKEAIKEDMDVLSEINVVLKKADLHFAYRVRDEIAFYLILNKKYNIMEDAIALDFQLMQKVLPRIHGSSRRVYQVLVGLLSILTGKNFFDVDYEVSEIQKEVGAYKNYEYPKSIEKLMFMLERFDEDRFTSFWI